MKSQVKKRRTTWLPCLLFILILFQSSRAEIKVSEFIDNFENNEKQSVLPGPVDSMIIERGPARFELRSGNLALADCGWGSSVVMAFQGRVKFTYQPPDAIECYQLHKFTGQDTLSCEFDDITFFWTVPPEGLPDTSLLSRRQIDKAAWKNIRQAQKDAIDYMGIYLPNALIGDLISASQDTFFYADFTIKKFEHLVFVDDPRKTDRFTLYKLRLTQGVQTYDVYGAFSPAGTDPAPIRSKSPVDITHFEINSFIENNFKMRIDCRIYFVPVRTDRGYVYLRWYEDNRPLAAK